MNKILLVLGTLWALPVTILPFLFYILPLWLLGKYELIGWDERAWFWRVDPGKLGSSWLDNLIRDKWQGWSGSTLGSVVVVRAPSGPDDAWYRLTVIHEKEHVLQIMKLGILQPIIYFVIVLVGRFICENANGYYDNIFEIDARRKAGMLIDIVGAAKKMGGGS